MAWTEQLCQFPFHLFLGSGDQTQVIRLGGKHLCCRAIFSSQAFTVTLFIFLSHSQLFPLLLWGLLCALINDIISSPFSFNKQIIQLQFCVCISNLPVVSSTLSFMSYLLNGIMTLTWQLTRRHFDSHPCELWWLKCSVGETFILGISWWFKCSIDETFFFWDRASLCSPGWSWLIIPLPQHPGY